MNITKTNSLQRGVHGLKMESKFYFIHIYLRLFTDARHTSAQVDVENLADAAAILGFKVHLD